MIWLAAIAIWFLASTVFVYQERSYSLPAPYELPTLIVFLVSMFILPGFLILALIGWLSIRLGIK